MRASNGQTGFNKNTVDCWEIWARRSRRPLWVSVVSTLTNPHYLHLCSEPTHGGTGVRFINVMKGGGGLHGTGKQSWNNENDAQIKFWNLSTVSVLAGSTQRERLRTDLRVGSIRAAPPERPSLFPNIPLCSVEPQLLRTFPPHLYLTFSGHRLPCNPSEGVCIIFQ